MILILGGRNQGKRIYAKEYFPDAELVYDYHLIVGEQLRSQKDPLKEAEKLLKEKHNRELVIITDEIGCGIVPLDPFERQWRETSGRVNCYFAEHADTVIRMIAGIGQRIK